MSNRQARGRPRHCVFVSIPTLFHSLALLLLSACSLDDPAGHEAATIWRCNDNADAIAVYETLSGVGVNEVVDKLNAVHRRFGEPLVELQAVRGPVATVTVSPPAQLTQQMGSTGAACYLAAVTYSLTSIADITVVEFRFPAGSHAMPGRYTRDDFPYLPPVGG